MHSIVPLPVVVPLGSAALLLMFGTVLPDRAARAFTIVAMLAETALAAALLHGARSGPIIYWFGGWTPRHGVPIGVSFAVDQLGAGAATFAGLIVTAATLTSTRSFPDRVALTHALMLTMLGAMAGFCLTGDISTSSCSTS
jgi:multicomponent Na+:H+ antiporter subunit D